MEVNPYENGYNVLSPRKLNDEVDDVVYERIHGKVPPSDVTSRLAAIELTQAKMYAEIREFRQQMRTQLASLQDLTRSLQQTVLDTAIKQETLDLNTQDRVQESADHLGQQLMDITKDVKAIMFDQRKLVSMRDGLHAMVTSKMDLQTGDKKIIKTKSKGLPAL